MIQMREKRKTNWLLHPCARQSPTIKEPSDSWDTWIQFYTLLLFLTLLPLASSMVEMAIPALSRLTGICEQNTLKAEASRHHIYVAICLKNDRGACKQTGLPLCSKTVLHQEPQETRSSVIKMRAGPRAAQDSIGIKFLTKISDSVICTWLLRNSSSYPARQNRRQPHSD